MPEHDAPSLSNALVILFNRYLLTIPYDAAYDIVDKQVTKLLKDPRAPKEVRTKLRRYLPACIRYHTFKPIARDVAESAIAEGRLEAVMQDRMEVSGQDMMSDYGHDDDVAQTTSLSVDYPGSLWHPIESDELSLTDSREWCDFLANRGLKWQYNERFRGDKAYYTSELLEESPSSRPMHVGRSHIIKPLIPSELKVHKHLMQISERGSWPDSLCKIDAFFPEEPLPDTRTLVVFPDYGRSFSYLVYPEKASDRWLRYTTLWDCVYQLVSAVQFLHAHGVAHLDINPANVALQVEACSDRRHPDPDSWYPGRHMHPRLTLLDLGSTESHVRDGTDMIWGPAGTPGLVSPEMQLYFERKSPSDLAREKKMQAIKAFLDSPDEVPDLVKSADSSDSDSQPAADGRPPPYEPFPADVWAIGNTLKIMTAVVTSSLHAEAMNALADYLMCERPSTKILDDRKGDKKNRGASSALLCAVKDVEERFELAGTGRLPFMVEPSKNHYTPLPDMLPRSPFY